MDTLQTLKTFLARLAGAPPNPPNPPIRRARHPSGLYAPVDRADDARTLRRRDGDDAEDYARRYLEHAGLAFVAANVTYRDGELDLVMRDAGNAKSRPAALVFVEVRRRSRDSHGGAAVSITREKRRRIVTAAAHYLVGTGLRALPPCRFDVVAIDGDRRQGFRVAWIRDAFRDEG